jgi:hypothetical protein
VREQSETRRELEATLRSFLPESSKIGSSLTSSKSGVAALGLGGVMSGYVWGRVRARHLRKKK